MFFVTEDKGSFFSQTDEIKRDKNPWIPFKFSELKKLIIKDMSFFISLSIQIFGDLG